MKDYDKDLLVDALEAVNEAPNMCADKLTETL